MEPTIITWCIAGFGVITFLPLLIAQWLMILKPNGKITKELILGKGQDWRDKTHFKSARAFAYADWIIVLPLLIAGNIGTIKGQAWGYVLWFALGVLSVYFSIVFWVMEKEYTFPSAGKFAYFTYFWGFFLYWGVTAMVYSFLQIR